MGGARGERDRLPGLEHVVSGRGDDVILGDRRRSFLEEVQGFSHSGGPTSGFAPRETGNDIFAGRGGTDRVQSLSGDDRLIGGPGLDQLACQLDVRARCRLFGGDGTDELYGSAGPDLLRGGRGRDRMFAFGGNDRLLAKDAARDVVGGGKGFDYARVDLRVDRVHGVEGR